MLPVKFNRRIKRNTNQLGLAERIRNVRKSGRRRNYWITVIVLAGVAVAIGLIFGPNLTSKGSVFPRPESPEPDYRLIAVKEIRLNKLKGITVLAQTAVQLDVDSLRTVLDWVLYSVIDEYNNRKKERVRVAWVYVYDDGGENLAQWRAMAIWVDPKLPPGLKPAAARIGGDAVREGAVEYDFTNPLKDFTKKE
ncbi:MAG: hypothetical protein K6T77_03430 [candidate division WOR-3 bacterium]|jgi:hypothetical protein|nr:hypothetical protein [candidate division WOR-3 bacterium]MCR4423369.1 hypothetical protein [candidate division WOR-3 bacterium]MDH7518708.1 hypothetical protein [bacterium]